MFVVFSESIIGVGISLILSVSYTPNFTFGALFFSLELHAHRIMNRMIVSCCKVFIDFYFLKCLKYSEIVFT